MMKAMMMIATLNINPSMYRVRLEEEYDPLLRAKVVKEDPRSLSL
jgi:hypothetical protein